MAGTIHVKCLVLFPADDHVANSAEELGMDEGQRILCQLFIDFGAVLGLSHVASPRLASEVSVAQFANAPSVGHFGSAMGAHWDDDTSWSRCFYLCLSKTGDAFFVAVSTDVSLPVLVPKDFGFTDDTHLLPIGTKLSNVGDLQHGLLALGPWSVLGGRRA